MTPRLSPRTLQLIERLFESRQQAEAGRRLTDECGNNLPFCDHHDEFQMERIRFAVLRIGLGSLEETQAAIDTARRDWRDVLTRSGFGDDLRAHERWADRTLSAAADPVIGIIMGVSGSGKTTVGSQLARGLNWMFYDADDFHSTANREKMQKGIPLTDEDRRSWLLRLRGLIARYIEKQQDMVLACSALKSAYRQTLCIDQHVRFVYLRGTYAQIAERMRQRPGHYMAPALLRSQFEILEEPTEALTLDISRTPGELVQAIRNEWRL